MGQSRRPTMWLSYACDGGLDGAERAVVCYLVLLNQPIQTFLPSLALQTAHSHPKAVVPNRRYPQLSNFQPVLSGIIQCGTWAPRPVTILGVKGGGPLACLEVCEDVLRARQLVGNGMEEKTKAAETQGQTKSYGRKAKYATNNRQLGHETKKGIGPGPSHEGC